MKNTLRLCLLILLVAATATATASGATTLNATSAALERAATDDRWEEVRALADSLLAGNPADTRSLALRAEANRRTDRLTAARGDYVALAERLADDPSPWFWIGTIDRWQGRAEDALEAYARALTLDLGQHGALTGRARIFMSQQRPGIAEAELRRALAGHPGDPEASRLLAEALASQSRMKEAHQALAAAFSGAELARRQGDLELAGGHTARALNRYERALEIEPANADVLRRLGEAERRHGDDRAALGAYRRALEQEPADIGSLYWVGVLATRTGNQAESLAAWEAILTHEPDNVAALVGKSRVLFHRGRRPSALQLADRALVVAPDNGEARTLRAFILAASGRMRDASLDYRAVLASDPDNTDARTGYERLSESRSWEISSLSDVSRVVEGLDDEGLVVDDQTIRPTRIEYLSEGIEARLRSRIGNGSGLEIRVAQRREAVTQLDSGNPIYDLDVSEATAGLDHRLGDGVRFSWRVGGSRFEPRTIGAIQEEQRASGSAALEWQNGRFRVRASAQREPFIYRTFAGDTQFRIFDHDRIGLRLGAQLGSGVRLEASAGQSEFGGGSQSDSPSSAGLSLRWRRGGQSAALIVHSTPFPERFLAADGGLRFVDYEAARVELTSEIAAGFRLAFEAESGNYGATPRTITVDGSKVEGPLEENSRATGRLTLAWSPPRFRQLSIGVRGHVDEYDFDTAPYNTVDTVAGTAFLKLAGESPRAAFSLLVESSQIDDDRDPDYERHTVALKLEAKMGTAALRSPLRLGLEGRYTTATLVGDADEYDEELPRARIYLRVPF
jgi:tetratricopeptide (TPR) repeat protein